MMSEFSSDSQAACWILLLALFTARSRRFSMWVTTLLMIGLPATSRSVAFLFSKAGLESHFRNSHAAPC